MNKDSIRQIKPGAFDESVAGEEDPGASVELAATPPPASAPGEGDEAAPGTPGTGEALCPKCGGSGRGLGGATCPECSGTGKVTQGIGGG
ncbi:hypothetical protein M2282_000606 [Variovorax boronicumulans]|uniref:hypothetical protein n=1 Tax=Variovorax boronicumulans TaxID=436515 RepID=UPI0024758F6E|nr:hypothetical protein [Variovorax boronicumulans]MDH6165478.1 hypothetical protein [Variovorax boronicumulans]